MTFTDDFTVGSILVWNGYDGRLPGHKVVDEYVHVDVDDEPTRFWIIHRGSVEDNKWVPRPVSDGSSLIFKTTEQIRDYRFVRVWTPEHVFQDGEFLTDVLGHVFYHENKNTVWRLSVGSDTHGVAHASLSARVKQFGKLSVLETASDRPFSEVVK